MLRGMFTNPAARNELDSAIPPGFSVHVPSKRMLPVWRVAEQYRAEQQPVVVVAGERYGTGSSRDWAAKGLSLLGVRAVLASSFERIHRSNLIGMGILPIELPPQSHPSTLRIRAGDRIEIDADPIQLGPGTPITITIHRASGESISLAATAAVETGLEVQILRIGGIIPFILRRSLGSDIHQQESIGDDESFRRQSAPIHRR
jgi:aconitate hydratase